MKIKSRRTIFKSNKLSNIFIYGRWQNGQSGLCANMVVTVGDTTELRYNEISNFIDARYLSAPEAMSSRVSNARSLACCDEIAGIFAKSTVYPVYPNQF